MGERPGGEYWSRGRETVIVEVLHRAGEDDGRQTHVREIGNSERAVI